MTGRTCSSLDVITHRLRRYLTGPSLHAGNLRCPTYVNRQHMQAVRRTSLFLSMTIQIVHWSKRYVLLACR